MTGRLKWIFTWLALCACACTSIPYKTPVIEPIAPTTGSFAGLRELSPGQPLKVLVVHGMCAHKSDWAQGWAAAMGRAFGSVGIRGASETIGKVEMEHYDFD